MLKDCPVEILQDEFEFYNLCELVRGLSPTKVVEIGSLFGGTLWYWMKLSPPGTQFCAIDSLISPADPRYARQTLGHRRLWYEWANNKNHILQIIEGYSQDPKVIETVYHNFTPTDFLFIDGDHSYEGVKSDFLAYSDLVRPGGLIALHDVASNSWSGVKQFWTELKESKQYITNDFVTNPGDMGIGVLYVPERR